MNLRQPTPVFLLGKFHGQRNLAGCNPWGHRVGHNLATEQSTAKMKRNTKTAIWYCHYFIKKTQNRRRIIIWKLKDQSLQKRTDGDLASRLLKRVVSAPGHTWPQRCKGKHKLIVRWWKLKPQLADQDKASPGFCIYTWTFTLLLKSFPILKLYNH